MRHIYLAFHLACLLTFYLADLLIFYMSDLLTFYLAFSLAFYMRLCLWPLRSGWSPARPTALRLSLVEVRRGPQHSDSRRLKPGEAHSAPTLTSWSPASPIAIKSWQMTSGEAPCDQELADDVQRGPLRSRPGRWSPARPTAIKSWQMRSGEEEEGGGRRRRSRASDIKSNNPHLAGGELKKYFHLWQRT